LVKNNILIFERVKANFKLKRVFISEFGEYGWFEYFHGGLNEIEFFFLKIFLKGHLLDNFKSSGFIQNDIFIEFIKDGKVERKCQ
jgi:hypothetical protein